MEKWSKEPTAVTLAIVGHGIGIQFQVANTIEKHTRQLSQRGNEIETAVRE
jgi:hypothetical protein